MIDKLSIRKEKKINKCTQKQLAIHFYDLIYKEKMLRSKRTISEFKIIKKNNQYHFNLLYQSHIEENYRVIFYFKASGYIDIAIIHNFVNTRKMERHNYKDIEKMTQKEYNKNTYSYMVRIILNLVERKIKYQESPFYREHSNHKKENKEIRQKKEVIIKKSFSMIKNKFFNNEINYIKYQQNSYRAASLLYRNKNNILTEIKIYNNRRIAFSKGSLTEEPLINELNEYPCFKIDFKQNKYAIKNAISIAINKLECIDFK